MKPEQWIVEGKVGRSSKTLWAVMMGVITEPTECGGHYDVPHDPDDFSRCFGLLTEFPEWEERLKEVSELLPKWKPFVREWKKLKEMYCQWCIDIEDYRNEKMIHPRKKFENGLYGFMQELEYEGMLLDGWIQDGSHSWHR